MGPIATRVSITDGDRQVPLPELVLVGVVATMAAIAAGAGVFLRGDLATQPFTTVRGDLVDSLVGGVYQFNGKSIAAEGVGWDAVTLFLVVPALLLTLPYLRRGSMRARLFATGILAYFVYQYFEYAMALAYGPLFAVYVAIGALSLTGIALLIAGLDPVALRARVTDRFPRRRMMGFGIFMAVLLGGMWLPLIVSTFGATSVPQLNGGTTLVVQAFDLGLLVPLGLFTAFTVQRAARRRLRPVGDRGRQGDGDGRRHRRDARRRMVGYRCLAASADHRVRVDLGCQRVARDSCVREHRPGHRAPARHGHDRRRRSRIAATRPIPAGRRPAPRPTLYG